MHVIKTASARVWESALALKKWCSESQ